MARFGTEDLLKIVAASQSGLTIEAFHEVVKAWAASAKHPRYQRPYTELVYAPMLEAMKYLRGNGYRTYIVTGGGQEFVRAFAEAVYGVPPEQVVGMMHKVDYAVRDGKPALTLAPPLFFNDDKDGKPVGINMVIGRRPQRGLRQLRRRPADARVDDRRRRCAARHAGAARRRAARVRLRACRRTARQPRGHLHAGRSTTPRRPGAGRSSASRTTGSASSPSTDRRARSVIFRA